MSTPTAAPSKPTPRSSGAAFTPSASSPARSAASPAHLGSTHPKAGKSPHKLPSAGHLGQGGAAHGSTPLGAAHTPTAFGTMHTPTPISHTTPAGGANSSPADGSTGRNRAGTLGGKSGVGSEAGTPALSGLAGLGLFGASLDGSHDRAMTGGMSAPMDNAAVLDAIAGDVDASLRSAELFRHRLQEVTSLLATRWGRVCQESLVAVVPRLGLEGMWEDGAGDGEVKAGKSRNYIIAGKGFSVEVDWFEGRVKTVVLDLPNAREAAKRSLGRAAEILRKDLVGWDGEATQGKYVDLAPFAINLQRLARADQLGSEKLSCFDALEGLFASLHNIWDWEMSRQDKPEDLRLQKGAEIAVLCGRSGRPAMHANRTIGLKLDYWLDRRRAFLRTYSATSATPAAVDERFGKGDSLWSLLLECEACGQGTYPPIRVSDNWVGESISKEDQQQGGFSAAEINWAEPPALPLPEEEHELMDIDATLRQTTQIAVRFAARFSPPLVLPYAVAMQIYDLVGLTVPPEPLQSFLALVFADETGAAKATEDINKAVAGAGEEVFTFTRTVESYEAGGNATPHVYRYRVQSSAPLIGRTLTEIPFSHPSQLVTILPYLRQWACVGQLLRRSVGVHDDKAKSEQEELRPTTRQIQTATFSRDRHYSPPSDTDSEDDQGPAKSRNLDKTPASQRPERSFDITLSANTARVDLDFVPLYDDTRGVLRVLPNAEIRVEIEGLKEEEKRNKEGTEEKEDSDKMQTEEDDSGRYSKPLDTIYRVLELSEDQGMLAAWMHSMAQP